MTLDEIVLQKLADWRPPQEGRHSLTIPDKASGWTVCITFDRFDDVGSALWELELQSTLPLARDREQFLRDWAAHAAARVTGLLETLKLLEVDASRLEALLRSEEPSRRKGEAFYYEVLLRSDRAVLVRRYRAASDAGRREQVPFTLTHEALAKLVRDLAIAS
jgi:hypothetical protein